MQKQKMRYNEAEAVKQQKNTEKQQFALQYRSIISNEFVKKLKKIHHVQKILTTPRFKSCLPSPKSGFDKDLKPHLVYELT